jgi:Ribosomal RNA-processing protein 7 (RRP7) C-terminal domain
MTRNVPKLVGLEKWLSDYESYQKVDPRLLQKSVDKYMQSFDIEKANEEAKEKDLAARMEADGFTLVAKSKKSTVTEEEEEFVSENIKKKRKRGSLVLGDFYKFQVTDKLSKSQRDALKDWTEYKKKVQQNKAKRNFKPFA